MSEIYQIGELYRELRSIKNPARRVIKAAVGIDGSNPYEIEQKTLEALLAVSEAEHVALAIGQNDLSLKNYIVLGEHGPAPGKRLNLHDENGVRELYGKNPTTFPVNIATPQGNKGEIIVSNRPKMVCDVEPLGLIVEEFEKVYGLMQEILTDELTSIYSGKEFMKRVHPYLSHHTNSVQALVMDLDKFKTLNDVKDHNEGDRILQEVAQELSGQTRDMDRHVAVMRNGGDEFLGLVYDENGELIGNRLQNAANSNPHVAQYNREFGLGVSLGISDPHPTGELEHAIKQADDRMYKNKEERKAA